MFKPTVFRVVLALFVFSALALAAPPARASLITQFDFVSEASGAQAGAYIKFVGGLVGGPAGTRAITFPNGVSNYDFVITKSDILTSLIGIKGNIGGTFTVGTISTVGPMQIATLAGTGTFSLTDLSNNVLSANLVWSDIYTLGATGSLNGMTTLNLTNWTYSGSDPAFLDIKGGTDHSVSLSFSFNPSKTLTQLMVAGSDKTTTYSGSFSMTPEPATICLMGMGVAVALLRRRRK